MSHPRAQAVQVVACAAVIGFALAYGLCDWSGWPRLNLDPYLGTWRWERGPTQRVPINYLGNLVWGVGGAAVGAGLAAGALRLWRRSLPSLVLDLAGAWALTAVALAGAYFTWTLWPF